MKRCTKCKIEKPATLEYFSPGQKGDRHGLRSWCRKCSSRHTIERRHRDPEYAAAHRISRLKTYRRQRNEVLEHYGGTPPRCACCGEHIREFLTVDHINGDGAKERKELGYRSGELYRMLRRRGYPPGYGVLCWNCNAAKGHYGTCPHTRGSGIHHAQAPAPSL